MRTFKHSGRMGDVIWSLPFVETMGGAETLYLVPDVHGINMTPTDIEFLRPLLESQPYILNVKIWNGEHVDFDLDNFRKVFHVNYFASVAGSFFNAYGMEMPKEYNTKPWLYVNDYSVDTYVISRTRNVFYRPAVNPEIVKLLDGELKDNVIFIGIPEECEFFNKSYGCNIPYHPVKDALELATIIRNCKMWIGNQAMPSVVAEATKVKTILEARRDHGHKDHWFDRETLKYI
jgi:hypothetical protein